MVDQEVTALATVIREEGLLAQVPPIICLQVSETATQKALLKLKTAKNIKVVQLSTSVFAYEPVLRQLQEIKELSLEDDILHWKQGKDLPCPSYQLSRMMRSTIASLENDYAMDLQGVLSLPRPTRLDKSQAACFVAGLWQRLSVIHGPPGTQPSCTSSESSPCN